MGVPEVRSGWLHLLVGLVALQGAALVAVAAVYVVELVRGGAADGRVSAFGAVVALVVALGLLAAARGLLARRRWARAPVLVVQMLLALVALGPDGVLAAGLWYVSALLAGWAVAVAVLLFLPGVSAQLEG